jgi:flagellar L-ring protein precursor FlgH
MNGIVTVTIATIYPNGTAEVVGEKQMALSQGDEWVQFAGRIRLVDIDSDNTLPSSRVANARIIYTGKGAVQQASRPGWLQRFFSTISPF